MQNKIDEFRKKKHMSYEEIAKKSGLTTAYISQLASGKKDNPSSKTMRLIAKALGTKVYKVFIF